MLRRLILASLIVGLLPSARSEALTCMLMPLVHPAAPRSQLMAHVRVARFYPDRSMDVEIIRLLHGREGRPIVNVDVHQILGWRMTSPWTMDRFPPGSEWILVLLRRPAEDPARAAYELPVCRALLRVSGDRVTGHITDTSTVEELGMEELRAKLREALR